MNIEENKQAKWYAIYTRSRAEKKLNTLLTAKGVECFLPIRKTLKQYSDRKKWVEEPLLRSYLLVRVTEKDYFDVLNTAGAVRYVCFEGKAAAIPDAQIVALQNLVLNRPKDLEVEMRELSPGELMEVIDGPMKGVVGEIKQIRGNHRLLLRFEALGYCVHTEVQLQDVKKVDAKKLVA